MALRKKRIRVLTGAPDSTSLTWDDAEDGLLSLFQTPFGIFLRGEMIDEGTQLGSGSGAQVSWRAIAEDPYRHLPTGWSQRSLFSNSVRSPTRKAHDVPKSEEELSFCTISDLSHCSNQSTDGPREDTPSAESSHEQDVLSQYYEHSFQVHEEVKSSQIMPEVTAPDDSLTSAAADTTTTDSSTSFESLPRELQVGNGAARAEHGSIRYAGIRICDVGSIPTASDVLYFSPQTMTLNLVVGVISIAPPRTIVTRRMSQEMELVELIVGDETKAGFGISFWLVPEGAAAAMRTASLRRSLLALRRQDVVLIRNVALSTFQGQVYGQSLRKDITHLELLHRVDPRGRLRSSSTNDLCPETAHKLLRVREWVYEFVLADRPSRPGTEVEKLPPDTQ
ncbi:MAG: mannose-1-phosphate guanyltransferase [Chaenotheca gracillima]|nr:MAG: mannose-1-phosphate guanyltransferase [Chaenotheca gracillima]